MRRVEAMRGEAMRGEAMRGEDEELNIYENNIMPILLLLLLR
jgi:hypothetical protein